MPSDYIAPSFSQRKQSLNQPSRNELQQNLGKVSTGVISAKKPTDVLQNFKFQ